MYFHTHEYIYLTYFNDEIIALDLRKDQYILLSEFSEVIYLALNNEFKRVQEKYVLADNGENCLPDDFDEAIEYLREIGILSKNNYNYLYIRSLKKAEFSAGASNIDWRMSNSDLDNKVTKKMILEGHPS